MLDKSTLEQETQNAIEWIREYVEKTGANGIIIGNSGGKDSATVLAMAVEAIGKERVLSVAMPCFSKQTDLEDAKLVAEAFEVPLLKVDLSNT